MDWWIDETPPRGDAEEAPILPGPLAPGTVMAVDPAGKVLPASADTDGKYAIIGVLAHYSIDANGETTIVVQTLPGTSVAPARYITSRYSDAT